jgi:hypothetical protein
MLMLLLLLMMTIMMGHEYKGGLSGGDEQDRGRTKEESTGWVNSIKIHTHTCEDEIMKPTKTLLRPGWSRTDVKGE